jgi:hypothetical protein
MPLPLSPWWPVSIAASRSRSAVRDVWGSSRPPAAGLPHLAQTLRSGRDATYETGRGSQRGVGGGGCRHRRCATACAVSGSSARMWPHNRSNSIYSTLMPSEKNGEPFAVGRRELGNGNGSARFGSGRRPMIPGRPCPGRPLRLRRPGGRRRRRRLAATCRGIGTMRGSPARPRCALAASLVTYGRPHHYQDARLDRLGQRGPCRNHGQQVGVTQGRIARKCA